MNDKEIIRRLKEFADALESGEPISDHFKVTRVVMTEPTRKTWRELLSIFDQCIKREKAKDERIAELEAQLESQSQSGWDRHEYD